MYSWGWPISVEQLHTRIIILLLGEKPTAAPSTQAPSHRRSLSAPPLSCLQHRRGRSSKGWSDVGYWSLCLKFYLGVVLQNTLQNAQDCQINKNWNIVVSVKHLQSMTMSPERSHPRAQFLTPWSLKVAVAEGWLVTPQLHLQPCLVGTDWPQCPSTADLQLCHQVWSHNENMVMEGEITAALYKTT